MHAADGAALRKGAPALQQRVGAVGGGFGQHQRPGPAQRRVARGVRAVLGQLGLFVRRATGQLHRDEGTGALVVVLGLVGGQARVGQRAAQQHVQVGRVGFGHLHAQRAGVDRRCGGKVQVGVLAGQRATRAGGQRRQLPRGGLVGGLGGRTCGGRRGDESQAVGHLARCQITLEDAAARAVFAHLGGADGRLGCRGAAGAQQQGGAAQGQSAGQEARLSAQGGGGAHGVSSVVVGRCRASVGSRPGAARALVTAA